MTNSPSNGHDPEDLARAYLAMNDAERRAFEALTNDPSKLPGFLDLPTDERPRSWADMEGMIGPIAWDWPGWLARALLIILAGESGAGKSALLLRIMDCYLRRAAWPDGTPFTGETGAVLWCEAEAAQAVNLARAKAWGLPIEKIYTPLDNPLDDIKLDLPEHRAALEKKARLPEVKLIVIDSLRGMHSGDENSSDAMGLIKWVAELARDTGNPIILSHHLRKRSIFDSESVELDRLRGSSAIVQTARLVWAVDTPNLDTREIKRLQVIKSNLAAFPGPVGMTIDETGVKFTTPPARAKVDTVADRAVDLLLSLLKEEPRAAVDIEHEFDQAGISIPSMKRAKERLGVVSIRKASGWMWSLPHKS